MTIHSEALLQSKDRLQELVINSFNENLDIPWNIISQLTNINRINLMLNGMTTTSVLESPTLETLSLDENRISTIEAGWNAPNLRELSLGESNCHRLHFFVLFCFLPVVAFRYFQTVKPITMETAIQPCRKYLYSSKDWRKSKLECKIFECLLLKQLSSFPYRLESHLRVPDWFL